MSAARPYPRQADGGRGASPPRTRRSGALVLDVDGTLAPIAPRRSSHSCPRRRVPSWRWPAATCSSPASAAARDARRLVGVDGIEVVGNHGLELDPARELAEKIAGFRDAVGLPVEDKGLSLTYHYREAEDEAAARAELEQVAARAGRGPRRPLGPQGPRDPPRPRRTRAPP